VRSLTLTVNDRPVTATVDPRTHLADFLREGLDLTGTHLGCEHGVCGACTLLLDGVPVRSCITYAAACHGAAVTTIEGLDDDEIVSELRAAFSREHALQCGYCTPGMLISARDVVVRFEEARESDIRVAMSGNLCRCTGYVGIIRAIKDVIASRRSRGIAALAGAGRTTLGPAGCGRAPGDAKADAHLALAAAPVGDIAADMGHGATGQDRLGAFNPQATLEQSFVVPHPRDEVWAFFANIREVAACLPGVALTGEPQDRRVEGKMRVKVGPIVAEFHGTAEINRDPSTYSGTIRGMGRDARSTSATRGTIAYRLEPSADLNSTQVRLTAGYMLTGPLAQFSRSALITEIANSLTRTFAHNLEARLASPERSAPFSVPASEVNAIRLILSALVRRLKASLGRLLGR
jgi:carbon-monoxide dehydrogenase small subunit